MSDNELEKAEAQWEEQRKKHQQLLNLQISELVDVQRHRRAIEELDGVRNDAYFTDVSSVHKHRKEVEIHFSAMEELARRSVNAQEQTALALTRIANALQKTHE